MNRARVASSEEYRQADGQVHGWLRPKSVNFVDEGENHQILLTSLPELYEDDEPLWALSTACILSQLHQALQRPQIPPLFYLWHIDWEHILDFLISAAQRDKRAAASLSVQVTKHILYLKHAGPGDLDYNKSHWRSEVSGMRDQLADDAASKIVLRYIQQSLEQIYQRALKQFKNYGLKDLGSYPAATAALEGLTLDNIMGDWWPESVSAEFEADVAEVERGMP